MNTVYPKKYAHGFCFAVLCCGYTLADFPLSIRLTSLALWQSNDCASASKATLMNMDKYLTWIHYEQLHNHNKAKHNTTVCIFLGMYSTNTKWVNPNTVISWIKLTTVVFIIHVGIVICAKNICRYAKLTTPQRNSFSWYHFGDNETWI